MSRSQKFGVWIFTRLGTLGWGTLMAGALLAVFEWSGMGTRWVHSILTTRLAALGGELHLGRADFQWLEPSLVLEDLSLTADEEVLLSIDHLYVRFGWQGGLTLSPAEVHLSDADVVLAPELADRVRGLLDVPSEGGAAQRKRAQLPKLPNVLIEDLSVLVRTSDGEQIEVLHVDLSLDATSERPRIVGRVQTPRQHSSGAPGTIRLSGGVGEDGVLNIRGQALGLEITPEDVPDAPELVPVREWQPHGSLDLEAHVEVDLLKEQAPRAEFLGRFERGSILPPGAERVVEDLEVIYELKFDPEVDEWLWDTTAWEGVARASGGFAEETFTAGALVGDSARGEAQLEAWVHLDEVDIAAPLDEVLPNARWHEELHIGADPHGAFSAKIMTRLLPQAEDIESSVQRSELLVHVDVMPGTKLTYHGWPSKTAEREPTGFPIPATVRHAKITHAYTRVLPRRALLQINLGLDQASGPADVRYVSRSAPVDAPPFASGLEEHLSIHVPRLDVNDELKRGIAGLDSILGEGRIWREYAPNGGHISVDLELARAVDSRISSVDLEVGVSEVGCTLETFPVPVDSTTGRIRILSTREGESCSSWDLVGVADAATFNVKGRTREQREDDGSRRRTLNALEVTALHVDVNGSVRDVLTPSTQATITSLGLEGPVSARLESHSSDTPLRALEIQPEAGVSAAPEGFPGRVHDLRGTLRLAWTEDEQIETSSGAPGIEGVGVSGERVSFTGSGSGDAWSGTLFATGLATSLGDTTSALASAGADDAELSIEGVVDLKAELSTTPQTAEASPLGAELEITLRSNTLSSGGNVLLDDLKGTFQLSDDGHIKAPLIRANLADSAVTLEDLDLRNTPEALTLTTVVRASEVPLDAEHLGALLEEDVLASLVDELGMRGSIDIERGELELSAPHDGSNSVRFRGSLTVTNAALEAGIPVTVQSARADIHDLIIEDGHLRGWGQVTDLYGNCFESDLGPVEALVSYVDGVLAVEDFSGSFERGSIRPLDQGVGFAHASRERPALSIELRPPFPYHASIAVDDVDASRWVEGISSDSIEGSGVLSLEANLNGNLGELVETQGSGVVHLKRSKLWSIPLFRELLREFRLDHTVVFDEIYFGFRLDDQTVHMKDIDLKSPLLKLVGEGTLNLEGELKHDLEVHYSLVDKITPFRRLFYLVQNMFVSVSIRGNLSRPLVRLNNGLFSIFQSEPEIMPSLPLPGLSPLPERF